MSDAQAVTAVNVTSESLSPDLFAAVVTSGGLEPRIRLVSESSDQPAISFTEVVSLGQYVWVQFTQKGTCAIVGARLGGFQHALGWAGTDTAQTGITAETDLLDDAGDVMEVGFEVLHPNRQIVVTGHVRVERNDAVAIPTPILRAAWDNEGTPTVVGILAESTPLLPDGANVVLHGEAVFLSSTYAPPDPGEFLMWLTLANGGAGTIDTLSGATVPGSRAWITVEDRGPFLPPG